MFLCFFFSKILHPKKNHPSITPFDILIANSNYYHSNTNQRIHSHITHIENISACSILARYWFAWCCGATNKPSLSLDCGYDYYGNDDVDYGGDVDNGKKSTNIGRMCVRASSLSTCVCVCVWNSVLVPHCPCVLNDLNLCQHDNGKSLTRSSTTILLACGSWNIMRLKYVRRSSRMLCILPVASRAQWSLNWTKTCLSERHK